MLYTPYSLGEVLVLLSSAIKTGTKSTKGTLLTLVKYSVIQQKYSFLRTTGHRTWWSETQAMFEGILLMF